MLQVKKCILGRPQTLGIHVARQSQDTYSKYIIRYGEAKLLILELTSVFHHLPSVGPKQFCALVHLGCTHKVSTS